MWLAERALGIWWVEADDAMRTALEQECGWPNVRWVLGVRRDGSGRPHSCANGWLAAPRHPLRGDEHHSSARLPLHS